MTAHLLQGDARALLATLPEKSVHCVVTSPPYWAHRTYQGVDAALSIGDEATPELWAAALVDVFREARRVLRDDGVLFVNCGDKYAVSGGASGDYNEGGLRAGANGTGPGKSQDMAGSYKPKDMIGLPWLLAFALRADGWWLRSEIIWHKLSPFPGSVQDRPTTAHESLFLLAKRPDYFWDAEAVRESVTGGTHARGTKLSPPKEAAGTAAGHGHENWTAATPDIVSARNARSVQTFALSPFSVKRLGKYGPMPDVAHFALMPLSMASRCIKAGTSERGVCRACGAPWVRHVEKSGGSIGQSWHDHVEDGRYGQRATDPRSKGGRGYKVETTGWAASCACDVGQPVPATVLDPFMGAGTTALAAERLGHNSIGIELSADYVRLAEARLKDDAPMLVSQANRKAQGFL